MINLKELLKFTCSEQPEREGEDFGELSRVAPSGSAKGGGDASPYNE